MNENQNLLDKIEKLKEIFDISELNLSISKFQILNEAIKQCLLFITIKKGKKEEISEEDIILFRTKMSDMEKIISNILEY